MHNCRSRHGIGEKEIDVGDNPMSRSEKFFTSQRGAKYASCCCVRQTFSWRTMSRTDNLFWAILVDKVMLGVLEGSEV